MTIQFVETADGTLTCFNSNVQEHYHNRSGAFTEAMQVYIEPAKVEKRLLEKDELFILDPFLGLGYNALACLDRFHHLRETAFAEKRLTLVAFESDPEILACLPHAIRSLDNDSLKSFLPAFEHKIYYQTQMDLIHLLSNRSYNDGDVALILVVGDSRQLVQQLPEGLFDLIFHDAFSPKKQPELWTQPFFEQYCRILDPQTGAVFTYSAAANIRKGFINAGFHVYPHAIPDGKWGTAAYKSPQPNHAGFNELETQLIQSKSGIPYQDNATLTLTKAEILAHHQQLQAQSDLPSSSSVHKRLGYLKGSRPVS